MSLPIDDSLNWQAMQYVLGELPAVECEAFEARLAHDQLACEAVASASRLVLTTRAALTDVVRADNSVAAMPTQPQAASSPRGSWIAVVGTLTAACLIWGLFSLQNPNPANRSSNPTAELISLWRTGVPVGEPETDPTDTELATTTPTNADREEMDVVAESDDRSLVVAALNDNIPHWMLAAVSIEAEGLFEGSSERVQEN